MRIIAYAEASGHDLRDMLVADGHTMRLCAPGSLASVQADACVVLNLTARVLPSYRSWFAQLPAPTMLITTALSAGHALSSGAPLLRIICHPSRALHSLTELLEMTCEVRAGAAVIGPPSRQAMPARFARRVPGL